jgi:protein-disulfide isomerase
MEVPNEEIPLEDETTTVEEMENRSKPAIVINIQSWATPLAAILMLVIGLAGGYLLRPTIEERLSPQVSQPASLPAAQADAPSSSEADLLMQVVIDQTRHFKGSLDAPVTIIEFSDFKCPYCQRFATGTARQIDQQYIQTGQVRYGYMHFAFLGPESQWAAEASECAADQEAFWAYHDKIFTSQDPENRETLDKENLKRFAADLGLDTNAFDQCLDSSTHVSTVRNETQSVQTLGVRSTPSFLVNGQPVIGAQPFEAFQQVIEAQLNQ